MMFMVYVPNTEDVTPKNKLGLYETELYKRNKDKLDAFFCPHCGEKGFLYENYWSITCRACEWHNNKDLIAEEGDELA